MRQLAIAALLAILALVALAAVPPPAEVPAFDTVKGEAEALVAEGSYRLALDAYLRADRTALAPDDARWLDFRLADLSWRSAPEGDDPTPLDDAQRALEQLLVDERGRAVGDRVAAEAHESLGDLSWLPSSRRSWGPAWQHYAAALDYWAGHRDLELARGRYLAIVWRATAAHEEYYPYGYWAANMPVAVIENAAKVAVTADDRSHAAYLLAMHLVNRRDAASVERTKTTFASALAPGQASAWYDDALAQYGQWLEAAGSLSCRDDGSWLVEPDYEAAVAAYRRFLAEFKEGESRYRDQVVSRLASLTEPSLGLGVSNVFLPGSKVGFQLAWRNLGEVELSLTRVDLTRDLSAWPSSGIGNWYEAVATSGERERLAWTRTLTGTQYAPGTETVVVDRELTTGAWLLEARAGTRRARELVLVTNSVVVARSSSEQTLVWVTDAQSGAPLSGARVSLWQEYWQDGTARREQRTATTDADGLAELPLRSDRSGHLLVFANADGRQAFVQPRASGRGDGAAEEWRVYATTDRPAYRPGETASWKITARVAAADGWVVPAGRDVAYEIRDPRGSSVAKGSLRLNDFGSAWAELPLDAAMALGAYTVEFRDPHRGIGSATLFRLEEYKLPEFRVAVTTTDESGASRAFRLGDTVEAAIEASYFFGGPVTNATVEVVVYQGSYFRRWTPERDYPWYFESPDSYGRSYRGNEPVVQRTTLTTDGEGRARLSFATPADAGQDFEYRIEARVTDASRREISAESTVRVTRAPYFAEARPEHWLYRPGDAIEVAFRAVDANDQPVVAAGTLKVVREEWRELWLDPKGNELSGRQLELARAREGVFPPPAEPGQHPWRPLERGYVQEEVATATVSTDASGRATFRITAPDEGYYRFTWSSRPAGLATPRPRDVVETSTTAWVASKDATRIGYHREGGVEILVDADTVRPGATVPAMIVVPSSDRWVLFAVEGEEILSRQLVHATGNVKLVELSLGDQHIPNVFLTATMVMDLQLHQDTKEIVVPPVAKFLSVELTPDRAEYRPREEGTLTVKVTDADGEPVRAELSLGVADESVYSIQEDLAGDPRPFFYGQKRAHGVQTEAGFNQREYAKLVELSGGRLVDERLTAAGKGREAELRHNAPGAAVGAMAGASFDEMSAIAEAPMVDAAPASVAREQLKSSGRQDMKDKVADGAGGGQGEAAVQVRSDFRSTVFWQPDLVTGSDGTATVRFSYPDSLTAWRATARGVTTASQVGIATATTRTRQPLIVRLQAPRFFVVGDQTVVSAVVNNNTDQPLSVATALDATGVTVTGLRLDGRPVKGEAGPLMVAANAEGRMDWVVAVAEPGRARLRVTARAGQLADAMEKDYPVADHGIDKLVAVSGKLRGDEGTFTLDLPARGATTMTVQVAPSLAVTMLDAIPYLIDYPYGCTEQTMSRFLPTVIVARTLADLGVPREAVASRLFGGIEQAHTAATHAQGKKDLERLDEMTRAGLARLYDFQHGDGGWGWWQDGDSDHHMSAYVVWGLSLARDAGIRVKDDVLARGVSFLQRELVEEETAPDRQAWMLHALAASARGRGPTESEQAAIDNLWSKRDRLSGYGSALYALSLHQLGLEDKALTMARKLENGAAVDRATDASVLVPGSGSGADTLMATAHWGSRGAWWRWHDSPVEATALSLRALAAIDPEHRLVEPAMSWLVKNRRGAQWSNTRDTALAVLALTDYLRASKELGSDVEYELLVNGQAIARRQIAKAEMLSAPSRFAVPAAAVRDGVNEVTVRRLAGSGALYVSAEARFFSREEPIKAAGNEIFLKREYEKLVGRPTLLKGYVYDRVTMHDGDSIRSGERVDVVVTVEVKNDYEYLLLEDLKPAGLEAVELVSGTPLYARKLKSSAVDEKHGANAERRAAETVLPPDDDATATRWVYRELRDRKVALFVDRLEQGVWEIRYTLRAEVPGTFHALPLLGSAMYVPEIRGNSDEVRMTVEER